MPTAIREVDVESRFATLSGIEAYSRCMLVFRWSGRVIGRAFVDVRDGRVDGATQARAAERLGLSATDAWLEKTLGYDPRRTVIDGLPSATVAICTRERPDDLERALHVVSRLRHRGHEVIVV